MIQWIVDHLAIIWTVWLFGLLPGSFAIFETIALQNKGLSLSMFTWEMSEKWPPIIFISGFLVGFLCCHFYWHWNPPSLGTLGGTGG